MTFLTVKEVCKLIQAKPSTVYQWAELGQIPSYKVNGLLRFSEKEIFEWLKSCKSPTLDILYPNAGRRS